MATITGTNFQPTPTVTFGGVPATNVVWVSSTTVTCSPPAHAAGAVDVTVTNPDGTSATGIGVYTYGAAYLPPTISGCLIALRADIGVTASSGRVSAWADQSGNANNFTQGTSGNQPLLQTGINSQATILFDGTRPDSLSNTTVSAPSASEAFIVAKNTPANGTLNIGLWSWSAVSGQGQLYTFTDGDIYETYGTTSRLNAIPPGAGLDSPHVYSVQSTSGSYTVLLDGTTIGSRGSNTVGFASTFFLGHDPVPGNYSGQIAELAVYNRILTSTERSNLMAYFRARYATP